MSKDSAEWIAMMRGWHVQRDDQWQTVIQQTISLWLDTPA